MKKFINRTIRHIKEGFVAVKRHFGMDLSSSTAITVTLLLVGVFVVLAANLTSLTLEIEDSISLVSLIDYDVTDYGQIKAMKSSIESLEGVGKVDYRTKDQEFDFYNETYPDMIEFSELYREDNPFHDTFIVYLDDGTFIDDVKANISNMNGISSVEDGGDNTYTLINALQSVRLFGFIFVIALVCVAAYLIYNTIKIAISSRQDEIAIMRNVGAKNSYIRAPFLVEGIIIGVIGSILPIAIIIGGYYYIFQRTGGNVFGVLTLLTPMPFILLVSACLLIIGVFVGFIGSYISVCKYLRLTR